MSEPGKAYAQHRSGFSTRPAASAGPALVSRHNGENQTQTSTHCFPQYHPIRWLTLPNPRNWLPKTSSLVLPHGEGYDAPWRPYIAQS